MYLPPAESPEVPELKNVYLPPSEEPVMIQMEEVPAPEEEVVTEAPEVPVDDTEEIVAAPAPVSEEPAPAHELDQDGYHYKTPESYRYRF